MESEKDISFVVETILTEVVKREHCFKIAGKNGDSLLLTSASSSSDGLGKSSAAGDRASVENTSKEKEVSDEDFPEIVGGALCIFYTESPFSDFHKSPFICDGKYYHSVEHFFQIQMIFSFGMFRLASKIIQIPEATVFRKTLRQNLKTMVKSGLFDEQMFANWRKKNAFRMMRKGNKAKFEQNFILKEQLLATGDRILIFTSKNDSLLGVGMTEAGFLQWLRTNRFCLEDLLDFFSGVRHRPKGLGRNYLGLALMELRAEFNGKPSVIYDWKQQRPNITPEALEATYETDHSIKVQAAVVEENKNSTGKENDPHINDEGSASISLTSAAVVSLVQDPDPVESVHFSGATDDGRQENADICNADTTPETSSEDVVTKISSLPEREVIILPFERRVVYQRKDAEPRVIGEDNDLPESGSNHSAGQAASLSGNVEKKRTRQSRWEKKEMTMNAKNLDQRPIQANSIEQNQSVLDRLKNLRLEKPMINPFSLGNDKYASFLKPAKNKEILVSNYVENLDQNDKSDEEDVEAPAPTERPIYPAEPGEILPDGPLPRFSYQLPRIVGRPAGLPYHLLRSLPAAPPPPGMENFGPSHFQFPSSQLKKLGRPKRGPSPPPMYYPTFVPAPTLEKPEKVWQPPKDPVKKMMDKAKRLVSEAKERAERAAKENKLRMEAEARKRIPDYTEVTGPPRPRKYFRTSEEGGTPLMYYGRGNRMAEPLEIKEEEKSDSEGTKSANLALDRGLFPFGMEATLEDLLAMGFVPPPILTDPQCRARNLGRSHDSWQFYFENAEAAFRHAANRWVRAGRLTTTGEYVEGFDDDEDEVNFGCESSGESDDDDEEWKKKKKGRFETQIIFVDTAQYEEYVRWYQANHGCTPLPQEISGENSTQDIGGLRSWYQYYKTAVRPLVDSDPELREGAAGPEQLYSDLTDFYTLARWQWNQWEMKVERDMIVDTRYIPQEQWNDGVEYEGKPVAYEYDPGELAEYYKSEEEAKKRREKKAEEEEEVKPETDSVQEVIVL